MNAIDTNVVIYAVDTADPAKQAIALALINRLGKPGNLILPWQVASEFLNQLIRWERAGRILASEVEPMFRRIQRLLPIVSASERAFDLEFKLRGQHSLSHWDALILAACIDAGIDTLYTEDLSHGVTYDTVQVINPFLP